MKFNFIFHFYFDFRGLYGLKIISDENFNMITNIMVINIKIIHEFK